MPRVDGMEFYRELEASQPEMTARDHVRHRRRRRHRSRAFSRGDRNALAGEALPAEGSAAGRARYGRLASGLGGSGRSSELESKAFDADAIPSPDPPRVRLATAPPQSVRRPASVRGACGLLDGRLVCEHHAGLLPVGVSPWPSSCGASCAGTRGWRAERGRGLCRRHSAPSALRRRCTARACSCETRDSLTPIAAPICFIVASP